MGMTLGFGSALTGLLTCGTPPSKGPGKVFAEAGDAHLAHSPSTQAGAAGAGGPHSVGHQLEAGKVWKQCQHCVLTLGETLLFPAAVEVLSRDTEVYPEARENKGPAKTEEEVAAEDGEENNQAGLCEQGTVWYLEQSQPL